MANRKRLTYQNQTYTDPMQHKLQELKEYIGIGINTFYGWHISNLIIYDKPKELSEFYRKLPQDILDNGNYNCRKGDTVCIDYPEMGDLCEDCIYGGRFQLTRPPQSWCYVEVVE